MDFSERFYAYLRAKKDERGWQAKLAEKAGISQNALSKIINGTTKNPEMPIISKIMDALGPEELYPEAFISRVGRFAPIEAIEGENLPMVPVMGSTGAGPDVELFSSDGVAPPAGFPVNPLTSCLPCNTSAQNFTRLIK